MISISEVILRMDSQELNAKRLEENHLLADVCQARGWSLITHSSIDQRSHDRFGVHLCMCMQGTAALASNFINHIKCI